MRFARSRFLQESTAASIALQCCKNRFWGIIPLIMKTKLPVFLFQRLSSAQAVTALISGQGDFLALTALKCVQLILY